MLLVINFVSLIYLKYYTINPQKVVIYIENWYFNIIDKRFVSVGSDQKKILIIEIMIIKIKLTVIDCRW